MNTIPLRCAIAIFVLSLARVPAEAQSASKMHSDRMSLIDEFLSQVYPDLVRHPNEVLLRGRIDTWSKLPVVSSTLTKFEAALCRDFPHVDAPQWIISTTGVPKDVAQIRPPGMELPHCAEKDWKPTMGMWFDFESNEDGFLVGQFLTEGDYFTGDIKKLEDSFRQKPAWTDEEGIARFKKAGAQFPPDAKEAFLKQLDVKKLSQLTDCALNPADTYFYTIHPAVEHSPRFTSRLRWIVPGKRKDGTDCQAAFEPIHGRLVSVRKRIDPLLEKLGVY